MHPDSWATRRPRSPASEDATADELRTAREEPLASEKRISGFHSQAQRKSERETITYVQELTARAPLLDRGKESLRGLRPTGAASSSPRLAGVCRKSGPQRWMMPQQLTASFRAHHASFRRLPSPSREFVAVPALTLLQRRRAAEASLQRLRPHLLLATRYSSSRLNT